MALKDTLRDPLLKEAFQATDVDSSGSISQEELTSFGYVRQASPLPLGQLASFHLADACLS